MNLADVFTVVLVVLGVLSVFIAVWLATAGLFGHAGGEEWGVSHYRLRPR